MVDKYVGATNRLLSSLSSSEDFPGQIIALKDGDGRPRSHEKDHFVDKYWAESHELENAVFSDEVSNDSFRQSSGIADFKQADIKSSFSLLIEALPASERSWQQQIGAEIGKIFHAGTLEEKVSEPNSIVNYFGPDFLKSLVTEPSDSQIQN